MKGENLEKEIKMNKMGTVAVPKIMLSMGIPMVLSMVLQACYNIVDSMFVARIHDSEGLIHAGEYAVNALTLAFPIPVSYTHLLEIEELNNVDEIENLMRKAEFRFLDLVEESSGSRKKNPIVNKCKEIICKNIHSKIRVEEIALQLNINKDYLSHLFRKTENITISQYRCV